MGIQERKEREFLRREQEILDAALLLFRDPDWETVTVEQIAAQAEIGKGTVYKHFASKDEIYARLALEFDRAILARTRTIDRALPIRERFLAVLRVAWDAHLTSQELHRVVLYCSRQEFRAKVSPGTAAEFDAVHAELMEELETLLREGISDGLFPSRTLPLLWFGARSAFWGAIQLVWSGYLRQFDRELYFEELGRFILAGLIHGGPRVDGDGEAAESEP